MPWNFEIRDNCWILHVCWFVLYLNSSLILFAVLSAPEELPSTSSLLFDIFYRYHKNKTPKSSTKRNTSHQSAIDCRTNEENMRSAHSPTIHCNLCKLGLVTVRISCMTPWNVLSAILQCRSLLPTDIAVYIAKHSGHFMGSYMTSWPWWQKRGLSAGNASLASPGFRIRIETLVLHNRIKFYANFNGIRVDPAMRLLIISLWRRKKSKMY